jgi:hypothetical protein
MGILLQPNTELIKVHGTDIELTSVYARIQFTAHPDGSTISVTFKTYKDQSYFIANDELFTTIHAQTFDFAILETETQSIETALSYTAERFTELGYTATIIV